MIPKYPYVVTVYRRPGGTRPVLQQFSFESVGTANEAAVAHAKDRATIKVSLQVVLQEWPGPHDHHPRFQGR